MAAIARLRLTGIAGVEDMQPVALAIGSFVLGRSDGNDIVIKKNDISRQHARLEVSAEQIVLTDLGSANGTRVNGHRVEHPVLLSEGDEVEFGDRKFRCEIEHVPEAPAAPPVQPPAPPMEETGIWTPPAGVAEQVLAAAGAGSVEATTAWTPSDRGTASISVELPLGASIESTGDMLTSPSGGADSASSGSGGAGRLVRIVVVLLIGGGMVVLGVLGMQQYVASRPQVAEIPANAWEFVAPPPLFKSTEKDIADLTPADRSAYDRALYFYEIESYLSSKTTLATLARKYPANGTIKEQLKRVEQALDIEVEKLFQRGRDNLGFLKYREARENFRGVIRLAAPEDKRRQASEKSLTEIEAQIDSRHRF